MVNMYIKYLKYYPFLYFMHMLVKSVLKVDPNTSNIYFCSKFIQNVVKKKNLNMRHHTHNKTLLHALNTLNYIYIYMIDPARSTSAHGRIETYLCL